MYITDFEYAGERLSEYGLMVCNITNNSEQIVSIGSKMTFNTVRNNGSQVSSVISTQYDEVYTATFEVGKFSCHNNNNKTNLTIDDIELSRLLKWLNQKKFYMFKPICKNKYFGIYYYASFNVDVICIAGNVIGLSLSLTTSAPFGFYDDIEYDFSITANNEQFTIFDPSDETGFGYPSLVEISCIEDGDIKLCNLTENRYTTIKNCVKGENITLDCVNKIIKSSETHPRLYNDFNYNYPRFVNKYSSNENIFTSQSKCNIHIRYSPICKAGMVK